MNSKKIIATFLLIVLFTATVIGWGSYRLALATDTSTAEVTMERLEEASTTESTEEASSESSTEEASTAVTTEAGLVEGEDVADTPSDLTTEVTTELSSTENTTAEESTQTITSEDGTEFVTQDSNLVEEAVSTDGKGKSTKGTVRLFDKGSWGNGHWYWYTTNVYHINEAPYWEIDTSDDDKWGHVVFCLNPGYTMNRGYYEGTKINYSMFKSRTSTCLINTAIEWYKKQAGDLGISKLDKDAYRSAQLAIWGYPGSDTTAAKIIEYAKYARKILNEGKIGGFKKTTVKNVSSLNESDIGLTKPNSSDGKVYTSPVSESLKYWAHSDNMSSHKKYKFTVDKGSYTGTVKTSIADSGRIKVTLSKKPSKDDKIKVLLHVSGDCMGRSSETTWIEPGKGLQNLSMGSYPSEKYLGIILGGKNEPGEKCFPAIVVPKQDELGNTVDATFKIWATDNPEIAATFSNSELFSLEDLIREEVRLDNTNQYKSFYWQEIENDGSHNLDTKVHVLTVCMHKQACPFNTSKGVVGKDGEKVEAWYVVATPGATEPAQALGGTDQWYTLYGAGLYNEAYAGIPYTYTNHNQVLYTELAYLSSAVINTTPSYGYSFLKHGEDVTLAGTKGDVTYGFPSGAVDTKAEFALYCDGTSVTRSNGAPVFSAGQQITSGMTWCGSSCKHTPSHVVQLSGGGTNAIPDISQNGKVSVANLPEGSYHFVEVKCGSSFILNPAPIYFDVGPDSSGDSNEVQLNTMLKAKVSVKKLNANTGKYLAGAEFTLYAKNTNTNNAGALLYPADWAEEAVVSRKLGDDGKVLKETKEAGWVPVRSGISNEDGIVDFGLVPYGDYLIVETKAPVVVAQNGKKTYFTLAEKSIKFTHYRDTGATTMLFPNGITYAFDLAGYVITDGKVDNKNIGNTKKTFDIKIYKHGDIVKSAEEIETPYGTYKHLVTEDAALNDVVFILTDAVGNYVQTLQTDENGYAKSEQLDAGIYWLTERVVDKEHHYLDGPIKVDLSEQENNLAHVETKEIDIPNTLVTTQLSLYKNQEVPYITKDVLENPDKFPDVLVTDKSSAYTYNVEPLEGAIFGVYTKNDVKNYYGKVIVDAGDCVGYIRTDKDGRGVLDELLLTGDYYFKEITNNREDVLRVDENQYDFTLTLNHNDLVEDLNKYQPVLNEYRKSSVKLIKKDGDTEILLPGVEFGLYDYKNNLINRYVTDENGEIRVDLLPLQTYYFKELEALDGYYKNNERLNIVADEDKMLYTITAYNDKMYDDSEDQLTDRSDFNDKLKDIAGFWAAITDNPDFEEETSITDTPKLGTSIFVNIFCSLVLLMCVAGIAVIWMPKKRK